MQPLFASDYHVHRHCNVLWMLTEVFFVLMYWSLREHNFSAVVIKTPKSWFCCDDNFWSHNFWRHNFYTMFDI